MEIKLKGALDRYLILVWFERFDRLGKTQFGSLAFLTFFVSMLTAAPLIYWARQGNYDLLESTWFWVLITPMYAISMVLMQNLIWLLIRLILWVLEEL